MNRHSKICKIRIQKERFFFYFIYIYIYLMNIYDFKKTYKFLKRNYTNQFGGKNGGSIEAPNNTILSIINEVKKIEIRKLTIYTPSNEVIPSINSTLADFNNNDELNNKIEEIKQRLQSISNNCIVIGNGGAGKIGLIRALAKKYNDENPENNQLYVIWRAAHSFENFLGLDFIDAAITYEPHVEANLFLKNEITEPKLLFLNHFEISSGKEDILNVKNYIKGGENLEWIGKQTNITHLKHFMTNQDIYTTQDLQRNPIYIMVYIIFATFYKVYEKENDEWHEYKKVYVSRYNHSAMGEKDETLFREALRIIYFYLKDEIIKTDCDETIRKIWTKLYLYDKPSNIDDGEWNLQNFSKLYEAWLKHVQRETVKFPWEILKIAYDNNYYHLNDKAFYMDSLMHDKISVDNILTSIDRNDIDQILINPGLLWSVSNKIMIGSNQAKFLNAITSDNYKNFINNWIPTEYRVGDYLQKLQQLQLNFDGNGIYSTIENITFKEIYESYTNHLFWRKTYNIDLEKKWNDWNPPQDLSQFIDINKQREIILKDEMNEWG